MSTVITNVQVAVLLDMSVNMYDTDVRPIGNSVPGSRVLLDVSCPDISVAVGSSHVIVAPVIPSSVVVSISCGQFLIAGGVVSTVKQK